MAEVPGLNPGLPAQVESRQKTAQQGGFVLHEAEYLPSPSLEGIEGCTSVVLGDESLSILLWNSWLVWRPTAGARPLASILFPLDSRPSVRLVAHSAECTA